MRVAGAGVAVALTAVLLAPLALGQEAPAPTNDRPTTGDGPTAWLAGPIGWIHDYDAGLKEARRTGRPMLLNFWCGT